MTIRDNFRQCVQLRREHSKDSPEWQYLTRAARKYVLMLRGIAPNAWGKYL